MCELEGPEEESAAVINTENVASGSVESEAATLPGVAAGAAELDGEGGLSSADNHATSSSDGLVRGWLLSG